MAEHVEVPVPEEAVEALARHRWESPEAFPWDSLTAADVVAHRKRAEARRDLEELAPFLAPFIAAKAVERLHEIADRRSEEIEEAEERAEKTERERAEWKARSRREKKRRKKASSRANHWEHNHGQQVRRVRQIDAELRAVEQRASSQVALLRKGEEEFADKADGAAELRDKALATDDVTAAAVHSEAERSYMEAAQFFRDALQAQGGDGDAS